MDTMRKGQMFIIMAIIIVTVLVLLKTRMNLSEILMNKGTLESDLSQLKLGNIVSEEKNNLQVNYLQNMSMMNNVVNFTNFVRSVESSNAETLNSFIIGSYIANTTASTNTNINITVYNVMGMPVDANITFTYDNSVANFTNLPDASSTSQNFTFSTASNANYFLLVTYATAAEIQTANITLPVTIGNSKFIGFYDIRLATNTGTYTSRFVQNITLSN
ncbi:hypothetical protein EPN87_02865 [archaeon]|nr:MAG: hypothetical protein EPN87_02865 [archaeon]